MISGHLAKQLLNEMIDGECFLFWGVISTVMGDSQHGKK